uniref:Uncharacterized protein n=1 Tax=Arundo donax TaxID=35708 RepID=A0A0A9DF77_ARUDO
MEEAEVTEGEGETLLTPATGGRGGSRPSTRAPRPPAPAPAPPVRRRVRTRRGPRRWRR